MYCTVLTNPKDLEKIYLGFHLTGPNRLRHSVLRVGGRIKSEVDKVVNLAAISRMVLESKYRKLQNFRTGKDLLLIHGNSLIHLSNRIYLMFTFFLNLMITFFQVLL